MRNQEKAIERVASRRADSSHALHIARSPCFNKPRRTARETRSGLTTQSLTDTTRPAGINSLYHPVSTERRHGPSAPITNDLIAIASLVSFATLALASTSRTSLFELSARDIALGLNPSTSVAAELEKRDAAVNVAAELVSRDLAGEVEASTSELEKRARHHHRHANHHHHRHHRNHRHHHRRPQHKSHHRHHHHHQHHHHPAPHKCHNCQTSVKHAEPYCHHGKCSFTCKTGYYKKNGQCHKGDDKCDKACKPITNGASKCSKKNGCTYYCDTANGFSLHKTSTGYTCYNTMTDPTHCGNPPKVCQQAYMYKGEPTCTNGMCGVLCSNGKMATERNGVFYCP
ncbi:uncharacterized protein L969DRAFT_96718 [Mixia osmundae IAM 14324]|uniref:uncharacterized protein n=1 Tax=Mixia osmundae (strain CBS 9802 / IAM 14324 / JCM 22182 / KY 12970) TaxID=764103 RepID=UPI0004A54FBA|nr:uncharacterized protein L969DRAFT_96718 [Mixia osmundae IAM 14324]KEI37153.1 hypothetical protein L969DRAFT_96718 [Mixia osmundae IAM 14324]